MTTRRKAGDVSTLYGMSSLTSVVLEGKSDWPDPAMPTGDDDDGIDPVEEATAEWSGDLYQEGDETKPEDAFAAFSGSSGEEAWLDRTVDGRLVGWVRDTDGSVWRYSDANAWAVDVDDSGMTRIDTVYEAVDESEDDGDGAPEGDETSDGDTETVDTETSSNDGPDSGEEDPFALPDDDDTDSGDADSGEDETGNGTGDGEPEGDDPDDDDTDSGDGDPLKIRRKMQGKSWVFTYEPATRGR